MAMFKIKIKSAMENSYVWPEIEQLKDNEQLLAQKYLYGNLKREDFERKISELQSKSPSLIVNSLTELEAVMEFLDVDEEIKGQTIQDMEFQYEQAKKQGFLCRFSIWFYRTLDNREAMYCATQIYITNTK